MGNEDFFKDLQEEIARELRLMETEETEVERVSERIEELYCRLHPADNLRTIPGIGVRTAQVFLVYCLVNSLTTREFIQDGSQPSANCQAI